MTRIVLGLAFFCVISVVYARDLGQWENTDPAIRKWYQALMRPDVPTSSCCGEADAYWADEIHVRNGRTYVTVTDDRPDEPLGRPHVAVGTEIEVPDIKLKWDKSNPTGHGILFLSLQQLRLLLRPARRRLTGAVLMLRQNCLPAVRQRGPERPTGARAMNLLCTGTRRASRGPIIAASVAVGPTVPKVAIRMSHNYNIFRGEATKREPTSVTSSRICRAAIRKVLNMRLSIKAVALASATTMVAVVSSLRAENAPGRTACTKLDFCYRVSADLLPAIAENVARVRNLIAAKKAEGRAIGYLSVPLSPAGGGSYTINADAAGKIAESVERRLGPSSVWILNPAALGGDHMAGASGADYMYMWTQILEGPTAHGEDFDFFYFVGPTDFAGYFFPPKKDDQGRVRDERRAPDNYLTLLDGIFDERLASNSGFKKEAEQGQVTKSSFRTYYGLRASVSFSYGSHDEWNIARMLNERRRGADDSGIANQLAVFFDGQPVESRRLRGCCGFGRRRTLHKIAPSFLAVSRGRCGLVYLVMVWTRLGLDPAPRVIFKSLEISRSTVRVRHACSPARTSEILSSLPSGLAIFGELPDAINFQSGEHSHPALWCCFKSGEGGRRNDGWRSLFALFPATDQVASSACRFYILGIVQGVGLGDGAYLDATTRHLQERKRTIFCPPENTPQAQMVAVVRDTMKLDLGAHPDDRKLPAASTIVGVMVHKFPCPK